MNTNTLRRLPDHPLVRAERTYRADLPPYDPSADGEGGTLVVAPGMAVHVVSAFYDWNEVPGLDMLYVHCLDTGLSTHVTPADLGWTEPLLGEVAR